MERATPEIDPSHRGKGSIFDAFLPATGETFTTSYRYQIFCNGVGLREQAAAWPLGGAERISALRDNLRSRRATDVLMFALAHPH